MQLKMLVDLVLAEYEYCYVQYLRCMLIEFCLLACDGIALLLLDRFVSTYPAHAILCVTLRLMFTQQFWY